MNLNKSQKKFIKKNLKKLSLLEIAQKIGVSEKDLLEHLKITLGKERLERLTFSKSIGQENPSISSIPPVNPIKWVKKNVGYLLFLFFLVIAVYANCLNNEFLSDDIAGIMQEKNIGNPFYFLIHQPINFFRYLNFGIIYNLFGLEPPFFRLTNILFHLGSVLTIFTIISLLYNRKLGLMVAGIFAVHPLLTEAVTWISGGIHAQYSFFVLLSFLLYLLARSQNWQKKYYLISLLVFFFALFTTEKSAILPLILLCFEFSFGQLNQNWKRIIPYFILSGFAAIFVLFGGNFSSRVTALHSQYYQEKGLYNPLTQIPTAISSYLQLIFWPDKLTLYHSEMAFSNFQFSIMVLMTTVFLGLLLFSFFKKNNRQYFFWLAFFVISLLPMLTPFKVAWIVAERYVYLGSLGIFVLFGLGLQKLGETTKNKYVTFGLWAIIIIAFFVRTVVRNVDWKNQDNLWLAAARTSPSSPQNHNNLGDLYARHGNLPKAAEEFLLAIKLKPDYGDAYHNLANIYRQMGKNDLAAENYQKALSFNPNLWQSYQNLAVISFENGDIEKSIELAKRAIETNPQNPDLHLVLGYIYLQANNKTEARREFLKTLELDPNHQKAKELLPNTN